MPQQRRCRTEAGVSPILRPVSIRLRRPRFAERRSSWSYAPATYVLVGINCLVFLVMVAHQVSTSRPTSDQLMYWGADNAGSVLIYGQWWRIVTAMFVHVGLLHLATNMWCLWNLGLLAEPLMGSAGVLAVYILTGAAGNLLSTLVNWLWYNPGLGESPHEHGSVFPAGAGASGAVFGIAGALIILLKSHSAAGAAQGTAQAAHVGDLLCRHQSGDRLYNQPGYHA